MTTYIAKWPNANGHIDFTERENQTWHTLFTMQMETIVNRACPEFIDGLEQLNLPADEIPQLPSLNKVLIKTAWQLIPVDGTVLVDEFFQMLAKRQFPVANFIRIPEELHYLQQPDVFHEIFGHAPLLMNHDYADFVQWYGETALQLAPKLRKILSRLFWFTIEFGLMKTDQGTRIFGGGILSSHQETIYCLESPEPKRLAFDPKRMLKTPYNYDEIQTCYFILNNLEDLYQLKENSDLVQLLHDSLKAKNAVVAAAC
ncbi:MAG: phenylalanine 4-monooxygenase [Gammaproteobacteria bacterium]|nr:phenylalanine 4-monooxygenase [Gammaproteobacteria bacterium]